MSAIQQNPDLLLKTNCNISITDDVITVIFSNDECKLTVKYDQSFEVLSTSKNRPIYVLVIGTWTCSADRMFCIRSGSYPIDNSCILNRNVVGVHLQQVKVNKI